MTAPLISAEIVIHALGKEARRGNGYAQATIARIEAASDREAEAHAVIDEFVAYMASFDWEAILRQFEHALAALARLN